VSIEIYFGFSSQRAKGLLNNAAHAERSNPTLGSLHTFSPFARRQVMCYKLTEAKASFSIHPFYVLNKGAPIMYKTRTVFIMFAICVFSAFAFGQELTQDKPATNSIGTTIPTNSKLYINPMDGFETYVTAALQKKKVPLTIVANREQADFELKGDIEKQKAGWAKTIFISPLPSIDATMQIINIKTGVVAYSISSTKNNAWRGKKGSAEHLAKNLAKKMQSDGQMKKD
jgi:hypothetical protein